MAADYKTITNLRGPAARITGVSATSVPAGQDADVDMTGEDQNRQFNFKVPRGLPGVNAVENDEAVATYLSAPDSETAAALYAVTGATFSAMDAVETLVKNPDIRAYAAAGNAMQRLQLPTHVADKFQATHPSVKFFPEGWNKWRYWMAFTPYPLANAAHEDPCIAVSQDGKTWTTPVGFTNPLDDAPDAAHYNADTELAISPDGNTMYCMWRYTDAVTRVVQFKVRSTTDGVNWTPAVVAMTHADFNVANYVSPTLAHDGSQWVMWGIDQATNPNRMVRLTAPAVTGPWSAATTCVASAQAGRDLWHLEVTRTADGYLGLMNDTGLGQNGGDGDLFLMTSTDGVTWELGYSLLPRPFGTEYNALYRGSLVPTADGFDVWFGAFLSSTNYWGMFRAQVKPDPALRATDTKWIPAWSFRPPVAGAAEGVLSGIVNGWMLDQTAPESVATTVSMAGWQRFSADAWFATTDASAGAVVLNLNHRQLIEGANIAAPALIAGPATTVPGVAGRVMKVKLVTSILVGGSSPWYFRVLRDAANAADTYPADVMFLGMTLTRLA